MYDLTDARVAEIKCQALETAKTMKRKKWGKEFVYVEDLDVLQRKILMGEIK